VDGSNRYSNSAPYESPRDEAPARPTFGGWVIVMGCIILGAGVSIALAGGKASSGLAIGCGLGAGLGVAIAQAAGLWPRKKK
jgi:hypothetical protein